ncbi:MAG TPA: hypothetical protein VEB60_00705 [Candidatus Paceibacterota bacterium]|nr:hypothetical protein [Candidatus Paceibacterota bacterium]
MGWLYIVTIVALKLDHSLYLEHEDGIILATLAEQKAIEAARNSSKLGFNFSLGSTVTVCRKRLDEISNIIANSRSKLLVLTWSRTGWIETWYDEEAEERHSLKSQPSKTA